MKTQSSRLKKIVIGHIFALIKRETVPTNAFVKGWMLISMKAMAEEYNRERKNLFFFVAVP